MERVDRNLPQHEHGEMHDQDDRKRSSRTRPVTRHLINLPLEAPRPAGADPANLS
jgi:hypothetical protein